MLFGTDGIRGKVSLGPCSDPIEALVNDRKITPDLLWLVGHVLSMKTENLHVSLLDGIIGLIILYLFKHLQMLWMMGISK